MKESVWLWGYMEYCKRFKHYPI